MSTLKPVFTSGFDPYGFNLFIFKRWGEVVWKSDDASSELGVSWDGIFGGNRVPDGTYTWKIDFKTNKNDERIKIAGHVNVLE